MKGQLVSRSGPEGEEYGIVVDERRDKIHVLGGDGLCYVSEPDEWKPLKWKNSIPCSFVELLPVYEYISPDDLRVKFRELSDYFERVLGYVMSVDSSVIELANCVAELKKLPDIVMARIKGREFPTPPSWLTPKED